MLKQGTPNKAWIILMERIEDRNKQRKRIFRFVNKYCTGLNEIERIRDRDVRGVTRALWRENALDKINEFYYKHLEDDYEIDLLRSSIVTFYREKARIDK